MKKAILKNLSFLVLLAALGISTTSKGNDPAFDKGSNTIGISIGLGRPYDYDFLAPAFAVSFDHGFFGHVGPGTIGIGGIVGLKMSYDRLGEFDRSLTSIIICARGAYHLTILKDKNNKFDPYAGICLGLRINHYSDPYYDNYYGAHHSYPYSNSHHGADPIIGPFVGAKYNFTPYFGAFVEVAYDFSNLRGGLNFNFGK